MSSDPWTSHGVNSAIPMLCGASAGVVEPAGGSQDNNAARLVSKGRTPTGAFFIGMDADYLDKPNQVQEVLLHDFARSQRAQAIQHQI